jgi:hypothetical protein
MIFTRGHPLAQVSHYGLADCVIQRVGLIVEFYPHGQGRRLCPLQHRGFGEHLPEVFFRPQSTINIDLEEC